MDTTIIADKARACDDGPATRRLTDEQRQMVEDNLWVARYFATRPIGRGLSRAELNSAVCLGLCRAAPAFRKGGRARFGTYAWPAVYGEVHRESCRNDAMAMLSLESVMADLAARPARREEGDIEALHLAIGRLDGPQREAVRLRWLEGLTFREIGRRLGVTATRAEQVAARGLAELRGMLAGARCDGRCRPDVCPRCRSRQYRERKAARTTATARPEMREGGAP